MKRFCYSLIIVAIFILARMLWFQVSYGNPMYDLIGTFLISILVFIASYLSLKKYVDWKS